MPNIPIVMTGEELVDKIIGHERDFDHVTLKRFDFAQSERRSELDRYLREETPMPLTEYPLLMRNANFEHVKAAGLYLPKTLFGDSKFKDVNFSYATLTGADFYYARMKSVNFSHAERDDIIWTGSTLKGVIGLDPEENSNDPLPLIQEGAVPNPLTPQVVKVRYSRITQAARVMRYLFQR